MKTNRIEFGIRKSKADEYLWLSFALEPTLFVEKWMAALIYELKHKEPSVFAFGALFVDEPVIRRQIERLLFNLKDLSRYPTFSKPIQPYIAARDLAGLIEDCSRLIVEPGIPFKKQVIAKDLVELLRHYGSVYFPDLHFHMSVQVPEPQYFYLAEADFAGFSPDRIDGGLYTEFAGDGRSSLAAFEEQSVVGLQPQTLFNANCQIIFRENFEYGEGFRVIGDWLSTQTGQRADDPKWAIGSILLGRPVHSHTREAVRAAMMQSDGSVAVRLVQNDRRILPREVRLPGLWRPRPDMPRFHTLGAVGLLWVDLNRTLYLEKIWNLLRWRVHRVYWETVGQAWRIKQPYYYFRPILPEIYGQLWRIKLIYHWARPLVVKWVHRLSWPVRKAYYFASYQYKTRIHGR